MKKISLSNQIVILFVIIVLTAGTVFTLIISNRIEKLAKDETYSRLITYSKILDSQDVLDDLIDFRDMELAFIKVKENETIFSTDLSNYVNENDIKKMMDNIDRNNMKPIYTKMLINYNNETIYYVITVSETNGNLSIILTNSIYVSNLTKTVSLQLISVFMSIVCLAILVLAMWSNNMAKRLHRIQEHVLLLPKTGYENKYEDESLDEIGELPPEY